jgi:hypothetical protein
VQLIGPALTTRDIIFRKTGLASSDDGMEILLKSDHGHSLPEADPAGINGRDDEFSCCSVLFGPELIDF